MNYLLNKEKTGYILTRGDDKKEVVIPKTYRDKPVVEIEAWAFYGCNRLTSITIPDHVTRIGDNAFADCRILTSIDIPDSVTSIGNYAFSNCSSLINIIIPDNVTIVEDYVFANCSSLTSVTIPDGVTEIGRCAFAYCNSLTNITISNSVTSIGDGAFFGCYDLTNIQMSDCIKGVGKEAFFYCLNLSHLPSIEQLQNLSSIRCVKGFYKNENGDLYCNPYRKKPFYYESDRTYKTDKAQLCRCGFHACLNGTDVFNYYAGEDVIYYEVEIKGFSGELESDSKVCGTQIQLLRPLTLREVIDYKFEEHNKI